MSRRTIIPNDFRDMISMVAVISYLSIFFYYTLNKPFLSQSLQPMFLVLSGMGFLIVGKIFTIGKWAKDGIQPNEAGLVGILFFGLSSIFVGFWLLFNKTIPTNLTGYVGILALVPLIVTVVDYFKKNA